MKRKYRIISQTLLLASAVSLVLELLYLALVAGFKVLCAMFLILIKEPVSVMVLWTLGITAVFLVAVMLGPSD
jgi:hypothetical protein